MALKESSCSKSMLFGLTRNIVAHDMIGCPGRFKELIATPEPT